MNIARRIMTGWSAAGFLSLVCLVGSGQAQPTADQVLTDAGLSAGDRQSVMAGEFVNVSVKGVSERDLAFAIAFFVKTPPETIAKQIVAGDLITADEQVKAYGSPPSRRSRAATPRPCRSSCTACCWPATRPTARRA